MDSSPRLETPPPGFVRKCFTVEWDILRVKRLIEIYQQPIFSHLIEIHCHALSYWRMGVCSEGNFLQCFLLRYIGNSEELDKVNVRFRVYLLDRKGVKYFEEVSNDVIYMELSSSKITRPAHNEKGLKNRVFIDKALLNIRNRALRLLFEIELLVDVAEADQRNSNPDLTSLANDMHRLLDDKDFCDVVWHSADADFRLNTGLLQARLPTFHVMAGTYNLFTDDQAVPRKKSRYGCDEFKRCNASKAMRCFNEAVLSRILHNFSYRTPPDPFVSCVPNPSEKTLRRCFTAPVCKALLSYLHSGRAHVQAFEDVERLSTLARCLQLHDLVVKLENSPPGVHSLTEMVAVGKRFRMSSLALMQWELNGFEPVERTMMLSSPKCDHRRGLRITLRLTKSVEGLDVLSLDCQFTEIMFLPMLLTAKLTIKDAMGNKVNDYESKHMFFEDEVWRAEGHLEKEDFATENLECLFVAIFCYNDQLSCCDFKRFEGQVHDVHVDSVRYLSSSLSKCLGDPVTSDVVLVAKGRTMAVHSFVLCARSRRFKNELRKKWKPGHKITHLVREIEFNTLVEMVKYMYSGVPDLENSDSVENLRSAAERFGVSQLKDTCERFLANQQLTSF